VCSASCQISMSANVSYLPDAAPLNPKQEFTLAWKTVVDPSTLLSTQGRGGS
jgi:hypothetical protein